MSLNRSTAPPALESFFKSLLGTPYSEFSPPGSDADGHLWVPGEGKPNHLDCSGATYYVVRETTGINIDSGDEGNALGQWGSAQLARLRVGPPIALGDLLFFRGATPPVGHTGMCLTYNAATGAGTYISAYDTAEGLCIKPFSIHGGTDGYVGAVRIVNLLPAAPPPPPKPTPKPPGPAPKENPQAHAYAVAKGMVQIDHAEASMAAKNHPHINWYVWKNGAMTPEPINLTKESDVIYAFANVLNAAHIPHAGA